MDPFGRAPGTPVRTPTIFLRRVTQILTRKYKIFKLGKGIKLPRFELIDDRLKILRT